MIKLRDFQTMIQSKFYKKDNNIEGYLNDEYRIHPFKNSLKIAMTYGVVGCIWIAFSGKLLDFLVKDVELYKTIELYKGWFYVLITTVLVFTLIVKQLNQFAIAVRKIQYNLQEINAYNEELIAMEEELKQQFEELNKSRTSLMISEERYELAVEGADCGIWDYDVERDIWFISPKWKSDMGYEKDEIENSLEGWKKLIHPEDQFYAVNKFGQFINETYGCGYEHIYRLRCKDGSYKWIQSKGKGIYDHNGKVTRVAGSHMDITNQKLIEQRLEWLAYYDNLTELPNRIAFENKINDAIGNNDIKTFALVYLDIDDFKNINDALGHVAGDYFLKHVAKSLKECLGEQDFLARLSGDEFAIMYFEMNNRDDVIHKLNRLMELSKVSWEYMGRELYFSFSAGVTIYPDDGEDSFLLLKNSDIAMYAAKKGLKNRYCFYSDEINQRNLKRIEMIHELRHAIDNEEFQLYYQPINCLQHDSIYGMEALIRWMHPAKGMISPMEFIPLAEETGLICEIDYWVLKTALLQKQIWESQKYCPVTMSINISGKSLVNCNLLEKLEDLLADIHVKRDEIQIEITETAYMEDIEISAEILEQIKDMGIRIALDDFGTGYSSLTYLEKLPIDIVKLDRKFIMSPQQHNDDSVIVQNLIKLTHDLKLKILAEGIETSDQLSFLRNNGCDYGQGYLFSKPLTADAIQEQWLHKKVEQIMENISENQLII